MELNFIFESLSTELAPVLQKQKLFDTVHSRFGIVHVVIPHCLALFIISFLSTFFVTIRNYGYV
jgi:hypothetical protein